MVRASNDPTIISFRMNAAATAELPAGRPTAYTSHTKADMNIRGINPTTAPQNRTAPVGGTVRPGLASPTDEVTISAEAREAVAGVSLRERRLADIKASIEAGTYDTEERFAAAFGRMLDDIA